MNATDRDGATPLYAAVEANERECVSQLLRKGADPNIAAGDGTTPLMVAAKHAETACLMRLLLLYKADPYQRSARQRTALHYAALTGLSPDVTNTSADNYEPDGAPVRTLIKHSAYVEVADGDGLRPLHYAAKHRHMGMADALLEADADVNTKDSAGRTALYYAATAADPDVGDRLLGAGAACHHQEKETQRTALHALACAPLCKEVVETAKLILTQGGQGPDIANLADVAGRTALHLLLSNQSFNEHPKYGVKLFKMLLDEGAADLDRADANGVTPERLFDEKCKDLTLSTETVLKLQAIKDAHDDDANRPGGARLAACG